MYNNCQYFSEAKKFFYKSETFLIKVDLVTAKIEQKWVLPYKRHDLRDDAFVKLNGKKHTLFFEETL